MSTEPQPQHSSVPAHQAELRRSLEVGQARIDGRFALLVQRADQCEKEIEELGQRIAALENGRWPIPALAVLTALGALAVAVWQAFGR